MLGLDPIGLVTELTKNILHDVDDKGYVNGIVDFTNYKGLMDGFLSSPNATAKFLYSLVDILISLEVKILKEVKSGKSSPG
jgi:hypothetical protein